MDKLKVAIVIINYNGLENTLDCLDSLRQIEVGRNLVEIVVVENGSTDGSREALTNLKDIHLVTSFENLGFAGGANLGINYALKRNSDYIIIINNDTVVDKLALKKLMTATKVGDIISPKIYFAPGFEFHKERYKKSEQGKVIWYAGGKIDWDNIIGIHVGVDEVDTGQFNRRRQIDLATGACMLVKRQVFEKIGLFDQKYFLYLEDMDFATRAQKANFKIIFEPQAIIWHKNAGSVGGSGSKTQDYYITRNRLLFAAKYAKIRTKFAVLKQIIASASDRTKRQALLDFLTLRFGKKHGS
ncbi:MAG: glycosyltransferase family 2 protein [Patescibacteria group bacterium]